MPAPTWIAATNVAATTAVALTPPGTPAVDDIVLVLIESTDAVPAWPAPWQECPGSPVEASVPGRLTARWYRHAASGNPTNDSMNGTGSPADHHIVTVNVFRGCWTGGAPFDGHAITNPLASGAPPMADWNGPTTTFDNALIVLLAAHSDNKATPGQMEGRTPTNANLTGITARVDFDSTAGNNGQVIVVTGVMATAGAVGVTSVELADGTPVAGLVLALSETGVLPVDHVRTISRLIATGT